MSPCAWEAGLDAHASDGQVSTLVRGPGTYTMSLGSSRVSGGGLMST